MTHELIPVLRSSRLTLRTLCDADHAALLALAHDVEVARYMHEGPAPSAIDVANRVAGALRQWELRGYGMMGVDDDDGFVGRIGIYHPEGMENPLLVYALARRSWGRGYATEAVGTFLNWARVTSGLKHVVCHIDPGNSGSIRVAEKFGALRNGTTIRAGNELGVWTLPLATQR